MAGSLMAAARELPKYKVDAVGVQEVKWDKRGSVRAVMFSVGEEIKIIDREQVFCTSQNSISSYESGVC
jgi:hypothetical protein